MVLDIGVIGTGAVSSKYKDIIKKAIEYDTEIKQREILLDSIGTDSLYQMMINMVRAGEEIIELQKAFDELYMHIQQEPTIEQLKKQIKYSKNQLEVKMLNKKLNQLYKENKRAK